MINHPGIASQVQTCGACPEQYEGVLSDGRFFYFRCRWGSAWLGFGSDLGAAIEDAMSHREGVAWTTDSLAGMFPDDQTRDATFAELYEPLPT